MKAQARNTTLWRPSILIVDDDYILAARLKDVLTKVGFQCFEAESGRQMDAVLALNTIDILLLDVVLPDENGFTLLARLKEKWPDIAVIMLTSRADIEDRLTGLQNGADDYITKPFDIREIVARINTVLFRSHKRVMDAPLDSLIGIAGCEVDGRRRRIICQEGVEIDLTSREFSLLVAFAHNTNKVVTRDWLQFVVLQRPWDGKDRSIDVLVGRLRRKLNQVTTLKDAVVSERSLGYRLTVPVTFSPASRE